MATIKKACKGVSYPKASSVSRRLQKGGSLGMKSVKAGFDKNPAVTRADIIVAAKKQAKKGMRVKKAQTGIKTSADSTAYFSKIKNAAYDKFTKSGYKDKKSFDEGNKALDNQYRQTLKGKPGYDKSGYPLSGESAAKTRGRGGFKAGGKVSKSMKTGGKMKKCAYGCK